MTRNVDVAVIGAGSAGLSAFRQVKQRADSCVLIDSGPLGTTCARTGCMPSKALIHVANTLHASRQSGSHGIAGTEQLRCDIPSVMRHVRELRDRFTDGMIESTRKLAGDCLLTGSAVLEGQNLISVDGTTIHAEQIIIATGSRPSVPTAWQVFGDRILTSETLFEQDDLPPRMAVIGLGAIGLELGQAFSRLGITATGFDQASAIGGLSDPDVNAEAIRAQRSEWPIHLGESVDLVPTDNGLDVRAGDEHVEVDNVLVAIGVRPNTDGLGFDTLGVELDERGIPAVDPHTGRIGDLPVYLVGDANGCRPILHEALDEGFIAGRNSTQSDDAECRCRRVPLRVVFCDPQCVVVGTPFAELDDAGIVTGDVTFDDQSRAVLEARNNGLMRLYLDKVSARLLGAEIVGPDAEHLGHLLALAVQANMTAFEMLHMPFYHPTIAESVRTALRAAVAQVDIDEPPGELRLCETCPENPLC